MENRTEADEIVTRMAGPGDVAAMLACDAYAQAHPERGEAVRAAVGKGHCQTEKLFTSTNQSNGAAQRLFTSAGFVHSGRIEHLDEGDPELVYVKWCR